MSTSMPAMKRVQYTPEMASRTKRVGSYRMAYSCPRKLLAHLRHGLVHEVGHGNDIGSRQGERKDLGRFVAVIGIVAEGLLTQVHRATSRSRTICAAVRSWT